MKGMRSIRPVGTALAVLAVSLLLSTAGPAQSASSSTYFMPGNERAPGGQCTSTNFRMELAMGAGMVPQDTNSTNFKLLGGFNAVSDAPMAGAPWLSGASPLYGPILGGTTITLHGHELNLGAATSVAIGGKPAAVLSRSRDNVVVTLPAQDAPGWQPVAAVNGGGTSYLSPRGVGILPMCELAWPVDMGQPFRITYRGTVGDIFYMAVATAKLPGPAPLPPYHHGLELNIGTLWNIVGPIPVTDPNGEFHMDIPGIVFPRPIYVQMLGLPTMTPGYAPGSLTNTISL